MQTDGLELKVGNNFLMGGCKTCLGRNFLMEGCKTCLGRSFLMEGYTTCLETGNSEMFSSMGPCRIQF